MSYVAVVVVIGLLMIWVTVKDVGRHRIDCGKSPKWRLPSFMIMFNNSAGIPYFRSNCR